MQALIVMDNGIRIVPAHEGGQFQALSALYTEYRAFHRVWDHGKLPGPYAPSEGGGLLLALKYLTSAGFTAFRRHDQDTCIGEGLFVVPVWRLSGIGRRLDEARASRAREAGYAFVEVVVNPHLDVPEAEAIYGQLGYELSSHSNELVVMRRKLAA